MKSALSAAHPCLSALALCAAFSIAPAHAAPACPPLPADSGLHWNEQTAAGFLVCRASARDGREVLTLMLTGNDPGIPLQRALRQEKDSFAGETMHWYLPDLGGQEPPGYAERRISVVKLQKDRYAQLALYPGSHDELGSLQQLTRALDLNAAAAAVAAGR